VPNLEIEKVEVYVWRRQARRAQFLALKRSAGRNLAGIWQPVTGKIERPESPFEAARREVFEETGLEPRRWWRLEQTTFYLDARGRDLVALPLLAAEVGPREKVALSREHSQWRFVSAAEAARLFLWDSQRAGLEAVNRQVLRGGRLAKALEIEFTPRAARRRARG
jgi:dATP pyrophosphohydrolase